MITIIMIVVVIIIALNIIITIIIMIVIIILILIIMITILILRSPLEDSRLFGPSPWKILAAINEQTYLSNPAPGENLLSGNLVMETGCQYS